MVSTGLAGRMRTVARVGGWYLVVALAAVVIAACGSSKASPPRSRTPLIAAAPIRMAHTSAGAVAYRSVGSGPALLLITGYSYTLSEWPPRLRPRAS
jgi:hypothetical protein